MRTTIILFISFLFFQTGFATDKTWVGTSPWWTTDSNWSPSGKPTSSDNVTIPTSPAGGNMPIYSGTAGTIYSDDLTLEAGATLTLSSTADHMQVNGDLSIGAGASISCSNAGQVRMTGATKTISGTGDLSGAKLKIMASASVSLNNDFTFGGLEVFGSGSFTVSSGVTSTVSGTLYNNANGAITLSGTANMTINATSDAWMSHGSGASFTMGSGTLDFNNTSGTLRLFTNGGTFDAGSGTVYCNGDLWRGTSGTFTYGTSTFVMDGSTNSQFESNAASYSFNNLTIAKDATDDIITCEDADADITVNGNLTITEGTLQPTLGDLTVNGTTTINDGELIGGAAAMTLTGNITMDNDAYMTINTSTQPIKFDGNLSMNGTSGLRNTDGATATFTVFGTSNTISCNTGANSSTAYIYTSWSDFDIDITSDWTIADLQIQSNSGSDPDISVSTGKTLTITGDFHNDNQGSNTTFTLEGTANLDVGGNFINETTVVVNSGTISIEGNFTNSGTFTDGTGTVTFDGSANSVIDDPDGIEFYNLTLNKAATADVVSCNDADADITVANNLTITEGTLSPTLADCSVTGTTTLTDGKYIGIDAATTFTGDITMNNDAIIDHQATAASGDINIAGSITMNGTSGIQSSTATDRWIDLNGATKTISVTTAANSSTSNFNLNSGASYTLNNSLTINAFYMSTGVNSFTVADGQTFTLNSTMYTEDNSSFTLTGAANMNIAGNAWLAHGAGCIFTLNTGTLDVDGELRFTDSGSGTFNANSGTVKAGGDIPAWGGNSGTANWGTATLEIDGGANQVVAGSILTLHDFVINNSSGDVNLNDDVTVSGTITMTSGDLIVETGETITIDDADDPGISGGSASTHIVTSGTATIIDTYSSTTKITYPLGDGTNYRPLALTPSSANSTTWTVAYTAVGHSDTDVSGDLDHISSMEYWTCDRSGGSPADAIMELTWHSGSVVNDYANLTIAHYDGTTDWDGIASTPVGTNSSGTITSDAAVTTFSPFTIGSRSIANPLPIKILYFDVRFNEKFDHVILDWRTASEKNNDYFSIERSVDGINWIKIGEVNGAGTSNIPVSYQYFDFDVFRGLTYYRLKQVDFDGEFDYSDIKLVNFQKAENLVYPNPSSGEFYINGVKEENDNVLVINSLSELVFSGKLQNNKINLSFLSKGIYFLIINNQSEKIIIE